MILQGDMSFWISSKAFPVFKLTVIYQFLPLRAANFYINCFFTIHPKGKRAII